MRHGTVTVEETHWPVMLPELSAESDEVLHDFKPVVTLVSNL